MQVIEVVSHLDAVTAQAFLEKLPKHIRDAFYSRADEIGYPIEAVLESAIASSLDPDSLSFLDCKPGQFYVDGRSIFNPWAGNFWNAIGSGAIVEELVGAIVAE